jgi:hypothetical protein
VAEGVPPDGAETKPLSSRTYVVLLDWTRAVTAAGDRLGNIQPTSDFGHCSFQLNSTVARSGSSGSSSSEYSVLTSSTTPSTPPRVTRIVSSPKLISDHCKARISLTLRPRYWATTGVSQS